MDFATLTLADLQIAYESDTPEMVELRTLLAGIEANRRLRFSREDVELTYPALLASGQLAPDGVVTNGTQIAITETPLFYYGLYRVLGTRFQYTISADLGAGYQFLGQAESFIFESGQNFGGNKIIKALMEWILHFAIAELGGDVAAFALGLSFKRESTLINVLFGRLLEGPYLSSLTIEEAWPIFRHFAEDLGEPDPGVLDSGWNHLQAFVQGYARVHPDQAPQIKQFALDDLSAGPVYYICLSALVGLWEAGHFSLEELLSWLDESERRMPALTLLRVLPFQKAADRQAIISKLASTPLAPVELYNLPPLYVNFINTADPSETSVLEQCNAELQSILESPDSAVVRVTLAAITRLTNGVAVWMDRFIALTRSGRYDDSYTPLVNGLFSAHPIAEKFGEFIAAYTIAMGRQNTYKPFDYALHLVKQASQHDLDQALVSLMIHDLGSVRWAGHLIYYSQFQLGQRATLAFDVLTLTEDEQRKLAVSFLQPFQPVELTIPPCIPLLGSPHAGVRQLVQQRLLDLTYSYPEVLGEVDSLLPAEIADRAGIIGPLRALNEALMAETRSKRAIAELDPRQTQPTKLRTYLQGFNQRARQSFKMVQQSHGGIMALARQVSISRGGGWKPTGTAQMQPLGNFHFEMPMARMGVLRPEAMDERYHDLFSADWQTDFDIWAQKIY